MDVCTCGPAQMEIGCAMHQIKSWREMAEERRPTAQYEIRTLQLIERLTAENAVLRDQAEYYRDSRDAVLERLEAAERRLLALGVPAEELESLQLELAVEAVKAHVANRPKDVSDG